MDTPPNLPALAVQPDAINYSLINPKFPLNIKSQSVQLKNTGGGVLAGEIIPQYKWIDVEPKTFRLLEGEVSQHEIKIIGTPPHYWTQRMHHINQALVITSNASQGVISIHYSIPGLVEYKPSLPGKRTGFILAVIFLLIMAGFSALILARQRNQPESQSREMLLTIGAQTIYVGQTQTSGLAAGVEKSFTPLPIEAGNTPTITVAVFSATPTSQYTFTPWPADQFPPPETLIFTYYSLLNNRDYDQAWLLLSENFQQNCCNEGTAQPIDQYKAWWETIDRVEVLSGQIVSPGANPLKLQIKLKYFLKNGGVLEDENIFSIIADPKTMRLLIDEVEPISGV